MSSAFGYTHNIVAILTKSEVSEGFDQIIDFLNGSYINYALTVNPHIYVSCIKQFWNTVTVKQSNDVTRLQALVDRKKVVILEAIIRDALRLADADGVDCLPNEDIFTGLAREPEEQDDAEEQIQGNDNDAAQGADTDVLGDAVQDQSIPSPAPPTPPPQPPQDIPSTSQVQSPPPQLQSPTPAQPQGANFPMSLLQEVLDACVALTRRVKHLEHDKVAQDLEITKLKTRVKKLERANKVKTLKLDDTIMKDVSNQGRMIDELDRYEEAVEVVTTAKLITEVVAAVSESVSVVSTTIVAVPAATITATITATPVRVAAASTTRRKGVVIKDSEEESIAKTLAETKSKDNGKGIMVEEPKPMKKKQQVEMDEALDYFKGMSYDDIRPIFEAKFNSNIEFLLKSMEQIEEEENRALESINETQAQKAAKRRRLNEEVKDVEEIKQYLEIVPDENDDVYTNATPLARKVHVVDYHIIQLNNKPRYKIIRAYGTHQLYSNIWKTRWTRSSLEESKKCPWSSKELSAAKHKLMLLDTAAERRLLLLSQVKTINEKCCC
nr:hypothetical protein [Tanacetum cinerariifolium]